MEFVIVTGLSGAGRSQAMKAFEDIGYFCVDNLPPMLIPKFEELCAKNMDAFPNVALVMDIRGGKFFDDLDAGLQHLDDQGHSYRIIFLEASNQTLIKRFKEARRTHPLNPDGSIEEGIKEERSKLADLRHRADVIIDTSNLNISQFKEALYKIFMEGIETANMTISLVSFGFKKGIPLDADMVFDVRVLPNPYYVEELRPLTGNDEEIQNYVMKFPESQRYLERIKHMIDFMIPLCVKEGRGQFVVAIGCTGGHHRSVTFANLLHDYLEKNNHRASVIHRELK